MIRIRFRSMTAYGRSRFYCYRVATEDLLVNIPLDALQGFEQTCPDYEVHAAALSPTDTKNEAKQLYMGPGWIGNEWRKVTCWLVSSGYKISVAGVGLFWISIRGDAIDCLQEEESAAFSTVVETVLGPGLLLALAMQGIWSFHGSAVIFRDRVIVFLGESGKGKSTLACWLDNQEGVSWRRISDDIVPVVLDNNCLYVLPHFPQLKIPKESQPSIGLPERIPVDSVYVLGRPSDGAEIKVYPLESQQATLQLLRHTVASRLFGRELLQNHFDFCVAGSRQVIARQLVYPLTREALQSVQNLLLNDLQKTNHMTTTMMV